MKCFEITNCNEKKRKSCYIWTSFQSSPEELDNIKCWVLKGVYQPENKAQLAKCHKCNYYLMMNRNTGIQTDIRTDIATICCDSPINNDKTRALEQVWNKLKQSGKYNVILDLSQVTNIYSCGLGLLVKMHKEAQDNNGKLVITGLQGYALAIFTSTKLSKLMVMAADHQAALQFFEMHRKKSEDSDKTKQKPEDTIKSAQPAKKRIPCWEFFGNKNPSNATNCDECFKKISPSLKPCWIVEGLIEGISFQYINEDCEMCEYFLEFGKNAIVKIEHSSTSSTAT